MLKKRKLSKKKKIIIVVLSILFFISIALTLIVIFKDDNSNKGEKISFKGKCQIINTLEIETGDSLPTANDFVKKCSEKITIDYYFNNKKVKLENTNAEGEYLALIKVGDKKYNSKLIIKKSTREIELEVQDITIDYGKEYKADDFVKSCKSSLGACTYSFKEEKMAKYSDSGEYSITIVASVGNKKATKNAKLTINKKDEKEEDNLADNSSSVVKVKTVTETNTTSSNYKYGVTLDTTTTIYYDVYSDGSKKEVDRSTTSSYNYNNFNASTSDLLAEATSLANSNYNIASSVVSYVNMYRSEVNVSPITMDNNLNIAASVRALEMGWSKNFSHDRPNGTSCFTVLDDLGIKNLPVGENIAAGYYDVASVSNGWKNSPGHYSNMISADFNKIGVGMATVDGTTYWVQIFSA